MLSFLKREMFSQYRFIILIVALFFFSCHRDEITQNPEDDLPPETPSGLSVFAARDGKIGIEWEVIREFQGNSYNIYRSINSDQHFSLLGSTSGSYFVDDSLDYDSVYYYRITAFNKSGKESSMSSIVSAKPVNIYPPLSPMYLDINARNWSDSQYIRLRWDAVNEGDIAGYKIYRSEIENFEPDSTTLHAFSVLNLYDDKTDLAFYKTYYYRIQTVDKGNLTSGFSDPIYDWLLGKPEGVYPPDNAVVKPFDSFIFTALPAVARYAVVLQNNQYFGEIWRSEIFSTQGNGNISVKSDYPGLEYNTDYYWRIVTYSKEGSLPNSISKVYHFMLKP